MSERTGNPVGIPLTKPTMRMKRDEVLDMFGLAEADVDVIRDLRAALEATYNEVLDEGYPKGRYQVRYIRTLNRGLRGTDQDLSSRLLRSPLIPDRVRNITTDQCTLGQCLLCGLAFWESDFRAARAERLERQAPQYLERPGTREWSRIPGRDSLAAVLRPFKLKVVEDGEIIDDLFGRLENIFNDAIERMPRIAPTSLLFSPLGRELVRNFLQDETRIPAHCKTRIPDDKNRVEALFCLYRRWHQGFAKRHEDRIGVVDSKLSLRTSPLPLLEPGQSSNLERRAEQARIRRRRYLSKLQGQETADEEESVLDPAFESAPYQPALVPLSEPEFDPALYSAFDPALANTDNNGRHEAKTAEQLRRERLAREELEELRRLIVQRPTLQRPRRGVGFDYEGYNNVPNANITLIRAETPHEILCERQLIELVNHYPILGENIDPHEDWLNASSFNWINWRQSLIDVGYIDPNEDELWWSPHALETIDFNTVDQIASSDEVLLTQENIAISVINSVQYYYPNLRQPAFEGETEGEQSNDPLPRPNFTIIIRPRGRFSEVPGSQQEDTADRSRTYRYSPGLGFGPQDEPIELDNPMDLEDPMDFDNPIVSVTGKRRRSPEPSDPNPRPRRSAHRRAARQL